jgi:hypothetical protein
METEGLNDGLINTRWDTRNRSPADYFESAPTTKTLGRIHKGDDEEDCGLVSLASRIEKNGKTRLLHWMAEKGADAQPARLEHLEYMAGQHRKIKW